ncbi:hypothetical protein [Parasphingorhabdus pacifica]
MAERYTVDHVWLPDRLCPLLHREQDLTAQCRRPAELGVADERIYLDHA